MVAHQVTTHVGVTVVVPLVVPRAMTTPIHAATLVSAQCFFYVHPTHSYFLSGTFCTYNGTKPVCGCFGPSCPGENTPPPTSSTHHTTTTSTSTFYGVTFSSVVDPFPSTSTSMSTSTGLTTGSVGFSSTTTSLSIPTS